MTETSDEIRLNASSKAGVGMPNDRLQAIMTFLEEPDSQEMRALRDGGEAAARWGGLLTASAAPAVGFDLLLTLRRLF